MQDYQSEGHGNEVLSMWKAIDYSTPLDDMGG